jgi:hypothetical protein
MERVARDRRWCQNWLIQLERHGMAMMSLKQHMLTYLAEQVANNQAAAEQFQQKKASFRVGEADATQETLARCHEDIRRAKELIAKINES